MFDKTLICVSFSIVWLVVAYDIYTSSTLRANTLKVCFQQYSIQECSLIWERIKP